MLGALIGAGASLLGGLLGKSSQDKANRQAARNAQKERDLQKEFAQSGIQWKVEDAKKAGISPLFALGANTTSYSPVSVGSSGGNPLGDALAQSGQDIGRAIDSTRSNQSKATALGLTAAAVQLEGLKLDNDIKRATLASKIATQNANGITPGLPGTLVEPFIEGQGNSTYLKPSKDVVPADAAGGAQSEAGLNPELSWYKTKTGYVPQIPQNLGDALEGEPLNLSGAQWFLRNKVAPVFSSSYFSPPFPAPPGKRWGFDPLFGEYQLHSIKDFSRNYPSF